MRPYFKLFCHVLEGFSVGSLLNILHAHTGDISVYYYGYIALMAHVLIRYLNETKDS